MRLAVLCLLASGALPSPSRAQEAPVFKIMTEDSSVKFAVKSSVAVNGTLDKRDATLTFASTDATSGVLDIKIQADSVNTGSGTTKQSLISAVRHPSLAAEFFDLTEHSKSPFLQNDRL